MALEAVQNALATNFRPPTPVRSEAGTGAFAVQDAPASPRYFNPSIRIDGATGLAVVQFRDSRSGDVQLQIPSERVVLEYQRRAPGSGAPRPVPGQFLLPQSQTEPAQDDVVEPGESAGSDFSSDTGSGFGGTSVSLGFGVSAATPAGASASVAPAAVAAAFVPSGGFSSAAPVNVVA